MSGLRLTLRQAPECRLDASALPLDPGIDPSELARRPLRGEDGSAIPAGDLFRIASVAPDGVLIEGNLSNIDGLATRMSAGLLTIDGDVGHRTGEDLAGGRIVIHGNAGHDTGAQMSAGSILVRGAAGDRTGAAFPGVKKGMTGGEIAVLGNAGSHTGAGLRRGLIAVAGSLGEETLHAALAGTVVAIGDVAPGAGWLNKRASLVAFGKVPIPRTYRQACSYRPVFVRVILRHLARRDGFPLDSGLLEQPLERYCGDFAEMGRGEILRPPQIAEN